MKRFSLLLIITFLSNISYAQEKQKLTFDDILEWNKIKNYSISNNGEFIVYTLQPNKGNPTLKLVNNAGKEVHSSFCGLKGKFTADSKFLIYTLNPNKDSLRSLKLRKEKKENFPMKKLIILNLLNNQIDTIHHLKNYKLPAEWSNWIAYQTENKKDTTIEKSKKDSYHLSIRNLATKQVDTIYNVESYTFADKKPVISYNTLGRDSTIKPSVFVHQLEKNKKNEIYVGDNKIHQLTLNDYGNLAAFVAKKSKKDEIEQNELYFWNDRDSALAIVSSGNEVLKSGQTVSKHRKITFSNNNQKLYYGISAATEPKDTTILDEEKPKLDIWVWNEDILQSEQLKNRDGELKKSLLSVYHIKDKKSVQLEKENFSGISKINKGDNSKLLAWSSKAHSVQKMWEGGPFITDFYIVDDQTGASQKIADSVRATPRPSTNGDYIYWYNPVDTTLHTYNITTNKSYQVVTPKEILLANEIHDTPSMPYPYGIVDWTEDDKAILVYDRYDIWKVDPENKNKPINVTKNGRLNKIQYRLIRFERNYPNFYKYNKGINTDESLYLVGHNELTREDAYYRLNIRKDQRPTILYDSKHQLSRPIKARDANVTIFKKENFQTYPNLIASNTDFTKFAQLSNAAPQQKNFNWGTVELVHWTSLDGKKIDGLLYKPENFNPNKQYPMIVNFYEKSSQGLHKYRVPDIGRSTIDYHYYTSNGYIIFNPDVHYSEGYPGEDAFNCVMPGISHLISKGFVDEKHIGAQGHSWGGYQTAYLATRTNLFAAIESGAPVVNMFSAYGGIRLWSGRNRSFQYEKGQSRIGKSIWEAPLRYITNSPLLHLDKVETPILIMHNDDDGAVPFLQGVEMFIALRRLQKPSWLLNYNEADHWPTKLPDRLDFQKRMAQFFNYYLKNEPMPKWMKEGIPATRKGLDLNYELQE